MASSQIILKIKKVLVERRRERNVEWVAKATKYKEVVLNKSELPKYSDRIVKQKQYSNVSVIGAVSWRTCLI